MTSCLSPDALERIATAGDEDPGPRGEREHLERCPRCQTALEGARSDARLFEDLRSTVREDAPHSAAGILIPGYVLEEEVYRGGQGVIYRARQETTRRTVACKVLHAGGEATARERYRFEREIELAASLRHPNIVTIHDSGTAAGMPWYAMEFVEGEHLDRYVAAHTLPQRARLELFLEVCRAVAFAHRRGVIHRDLKPENVVVTEAGVPVVLDFGIARAIGAEHERAFPLRVTASGEFMGTLAYASPEQILGRADEIGTATDVYSLGVMLYELVTGSLPFPVDGPIKETLEHALHREPPDPRRLGKKVDSDLATLIHRTLATEPERRYPSADALTRDLERYLEGRPIEATGDRIGYLLRKAVARHRVGLALAATLVLIVGVGVVAFVRERLRAERKETTALEIQAVLKDIVAAAQPGRMGAGVTLLEVLDQASDAIESSLVNAPDSRAAVEFAIGETYWHLRLLEEAERHLRSALEHYRRVEPRGLATAQALHVLGLVLCYHDDDGSIELLEESLQLRLRLLGPDHDDVAAAKRALGYALLQANERDDPERAAELLTEALASFEESHGPEHTEVAKTTYRWAELHLQREEHAAARAAYGRALGVFERLSVRDDPIVLECLQSAASLARWEERYEDAETLLQRSFELAGEAYGDRWLPGILRNFARLHRARGDVETGLVFTRRSVAAELERWARRHRERGPELLGLAEDVRTSADGEAPWLDAFRALQDYHRASPYYLAGWMNEVAELVKARGDLEGAAYLAREATRQGCHIYGEDCPVRLRALENLARILIQSGAAQEAAETLREALQLRERRGWLQDDEASWAQTALAELEG